MKSVGFFLLVFSGMLLTLWLVVDKDSTPLPDVGFEQAGESFRLDPRGNHFELPVFDAEKQRLMYRLSGYLDDSLEALDPQKVDHLVLYDGKLEIPIYDDSSSSEEGSEEDSDAQPSHITWTFKKAEFNQKGEKNRLKNTKVVYLTEGGRGETDKGTVIEFEELVINIEENFVEQPRGTDDEEPTIKRKQVYEVHSDKRVRIHNKLFSIESPSGMRSRLREKDKLQLITFNPPVWTYLDAAAAQSFGVAKGSKPSERTRDGAPPAKLAITCEGPLILNRLSDPPHINFQKDVRIYPVQERTPGQAPPMGESWLHCQDFRVEIDDRETPPTVSLARATWEGGRVRAYHAGASAEGSVLTWRPAADSAEQNARWEAVLDGRPAFRQQGIEWQADVATLTVDEDRLKGIVWENNIEGSFEIDVDRLGADGSEQRAAADPPAEGGEGELSKQETGRAGISKKWGFRGGDTMELVFDRDAETTDTGGGDQPRGDDPVVELKGVSSFEARSKTDDGLIIESAAPGGGTLRGRTLSYDSTVGVAVLAGADRLSPRFDHPRASGTAEEIHLLLNERLLRFDKRVSVDVNLDSTTGDESDGTSGAERGGQMQAVRIVSEQLDVSFDERDGEMPIHSMEARTLGRRPVTLTPISSRTGEFRFEGPTLHWDQRHQTATMEAVEMGPHGSGTLFLPKLHFQDGSLTAHKLRFDRDSWVAYLEDSVEIKVTRSAEETDAGSEEVPTVVRADRAEVEFFEGFQALGAATSQLRRVRHIHAWEAAPEDPITISSAEFSGKAHEVTWSSAEQALRMFGGDFQEFRRSREDLLRAEEITYRMVDGRIELRRNVAGQIELVEKAGEVSPRPARGGEPFASNQSPPSAVAGADAEALLWTYETPALDVDVRHDDSSRRLELERLQASEKVVLRSEARGLELRGDDLEYDHRLQEIRVFSRHGRLQTLFHHQKVADGAGGFRVRTSRIDSREIRVWYNKDPAPMGSARGADDVVVEFQGEVVASFYLPEDSSKVVHSSLKADGGQDEPWKLKADRLTLHILREEGRSESSQYAYAQGDVFFSSEIKQLNVFAKEGIYDGPANRLLLRGDKTQKVRVISGKNVIVNDEIELTKLGTEFKLRSRKRR